MDDDVAAMTPEERIANGLCCECGRDMTGLNPVSHAGEHWSEYLRDDGRNQEALKRQSMLKAMTPIPPVKKERQQHQAKPPVATDKPPLKV